jgi:3-isopropylmalate/(R)-2-methylmalate dehydratase small subunit
VRGPDGGVVHFDIDPFKKHCLLNGLDAVGLTLEKTDRISTFEKAAAVERPWV